MHIMQNRVLIYSKPNIGDGPPPPELRTNSTFMFCIATAQRKYTIGQQKNDQIFSKTASGGYQCVATVNQGCAGQPFFLQARKSINFTKVRKRKI